MNYFLKHRKIVFLALLSIFVCSGLLFFPQQGMAMGDAFKEALQSQPKPAEGDCVPGFKSFVKSLAAGILDMFLWIPKKVSQIAVYISDQVIVIKDWPITNSNSGEHTAGAKAFSQGWVFVRDLANMLIVLGFVIVGIATALRIRDYEAKNLLFKLIAVALLINFSGLMCGLIIDASNLTMSGLIQQNTGTAGSQTQKTESIGSRFFNKIDNVEFDVLCKIANNDAIGKYVMTDVMFGLIYLAIGICFLILALVLMARYAVLGILFMLSPLAVALWIYPATKKWWDKWWESFLNWAFIGIGIAFSLNIAGHIVKGTTLNIRPDPDGVMESIIYLLIPLVLIVAGIMISIKSSVGGAVMAMAGGIAGFAAGATAKGASFLANKTGLAKAGNLMKNKAGLAAERIGLRQPGTTAGNAAKEIEERQKSIANLSPERQAQLAKSKTAGVSLDASRNRVAAIQQLAKTGNLSKLGNVDEQRKALDHVEAYQRSRGIVAKDGISQTRRDALKSNPNLATKPEEMKKAVQKQAPREFSKNIDSGAITKEVLAAADGRQVEHLATQAPKAKRDALRSLVRGPKRAETAAYARSLPKGEERSNLIKNMTKAREFLK